MEIGIKTVKKIYHGERGEEKVRYIENVYRQIKEKGVPHVDTLTHVAGSTIYLELKGIGVKPSNEKELLEAIICLLQALQACTIILNPGMLISYHTIGSPPTAIIIS